MKRSVRIISMVLCLVVMIFSFAACSDSGAPTHSVKNTKYAIEASKLESELEAFLDGREDRTSFTHAEEFAAMYLQQRLVSFGYSDAEIQDITVSEDGNDGLSSRNVVAHYRTGDRDAKTKNVVIGAYYDNRYSSAYKNAKVYKSEGALANGTGVATLLSIADYLMTEKPELGYDVTVVFFGASFVTAAGAEEFYKDMEPSERSNTVLMIELQRLGGDHVYAFSDARTTKREEFFDKIAADNELNIYKPTQKSPLVTDASVLKGVPFYQWAHNGLFGTFFNSNIPTLNLVGANWETLDFTDRESADHDNISYTENDDLKTLKRQYPDYAQKMSAAATLVIRSLESEAFLSTMNYDKSNFPDTDVLTKSWIWYIVVLGAVMIAAAIMMFATSRIAKKYPIVMPRPRQMKMAVFGMDYEDKNSDNIFIDIRSAAPQNEDIFPGVPNNDNDSQGAKTPFDDIFPMLGGTDGVQEVKPIDAPQPDAEQRSKPEEKTSDDPFDDMRNNKPDAGAEASGKDDLADDAPSTDRTHTTDKSITVEKKPVAKRRTVSAGKSNTAKKPLNTSGNKKDGKAQPPDDSDKAE